MKCKPIGKDVYKRQQLYGVKIITVWSWIRSGKLNAVKPGKNYFIREEDLMAFESAGR